MAKNNLHGDDNYECTPETPFDFLQPGMKYGMTQAGFGGNYVLRSNPIGGIVDIITGWCAPTPMMDDGNGGFEDLSGNDSGSPGTDSFPVLGPAVGSPFVGGYGSGPQAPADQMPTCGGGTVYDPSAMMCVPGNSLSGEIPEPFGEEAQNTAINKLQMAIANCNVAGINAVRNQAALARTLTDKMTAARWKQIQKAGDNALNGCRNQARANNAKRTSQTQGIKSNGRPFAYITGLADPMSLTESKPSFMSHQTVMAGMFDPGKI